MDRCREDVVCRLGSVDVIIRCTGEWLPSGSPRCREIRLLITSFMFMFVWVPLPVCQTLSGNWSSCWPLAMVSAASAIALPWLIENLHLGVDHNTGLFDLGQRMDQLSRHPLITDREILRDCWSGRPRARLQEH